MRNVSVYNPANFGGYSSGFGSYTRFGKGYYVPPPQQPKTDPAMLMILQMMMEELRELRKFRNTPQKDAQVTVIEKKVDQIAQQAGGEEAKQLVKEIKQEVVKQVTPVREQQREMEAKKIFTSEESEAEVAGSGGKRVRELLTSAGQAKFTRSSTKPGANLEPTHFKRYLKDVPSDFDEAKYLAKHPDVAKAVKAGAMPSGLWHYVRYGKKEGRALAGFDLAGLMQNKLLLAAAAAAAGYYFFIHNK